jgi:hypothetical protein
MRSTKTISIFFGILLILLSCQNNGRLKFTPKEFLGYVEGVENNFILQKEFENADFKCFYRPPEYQALISLNGKTFDNDSLEKLTLGFAEWITLSLRISLPENKHPLNKSELTSAQYAGRLEYYMNGQRDFNLVIDNKDTLECSLYHLERNYGAAPFLEINLGFKREKQINENITLHYYDRVFSNGLVKFYYDGEKLNQRPIFEI